MQSRATSTWNALATEARAWMLWTGESVPERSWLEFLSPLERAHHSQLKRDAMRREYLAARAICRMALSRCAGIDPAAWEFGKGKNGKPRIARPREFASLRFNLTHTRGLVIFAVTRVGEIGVDAEEKSRKVNVEQVAKHFFSKRERDSLRNVPETNRKSRFFEHWVLKEAYLKGRGDGLTREPGGFTIEIGDDLQVACLGNWQLTLHRPSRHHIAATAVRAKRSVPIRWLDALRLFKTGVAVE